MPLSSRISAEITDVKQVVVVVKLFLPLFVSGRSVRGCGVWPGGGPERADRVPVAPHSRRLHPHDPPHVTHLSVRPHRHHKPRLQSGPASRARRSQDRQVCSLLITIYYY